MKSSAAAALVVMGAILILAPAIMDFLYQVNMVHLAVRATTATSVVAQMSAGYRIFLIIFGALMVFIGVGMGFASLERSPKT